MIPARAVAVKNIKNAVAQTADEIFYMSSCPCKEPSSLT